MKRFELEIGLYIDADNIDEMWNIVKNSGLHDLLNQLDAEDGYCSEVVGEIELKG